MANAAATQRRRADYATASPSYPSGRRDNPERDKDPTSDESIHTGIGEREPGVNPTAGHPAMARVSCCSAHASRIDANGSNREAMAGVGVVLGDQPSDTVTGVPERWTPRPRFRRYRCAAVLSADRRLPPSRAYRRRPAIPRGNYRCIDPGRSRAERCPVVR